MYNVVTNTATSHEHVVDIERYIRTVKICIIDIVNTLPFNYLPKFIVVNLFYFGVM